MPVAVDSLPLSALNHFLYCSRRAYLIHAERVFVKVPSWRADIEGKADIVEEIVRIAGLDSIVSTPLQRDSAAIPAPILTLLQKRTRQCAPF